MAGITKRARPLCAAHATFDVIAHTLLGVRPLLGGLHSWAFAAQDACVPDFVGLVIELLCELWRLEGSHPIATQIDAAILAASRDGGSVRSPGAPVGALRVLDEKTARAMLARMDALSPTAGRRSSSSTAPSASIVKPSRTG